MAGAPDNCCFIPPPSVPRACRHSGHCARVARLQETPRQSAAQAGLTPTTAPRALSPRYLALHTTALLSKSRPFPAQGASGPGWGVSGETEFKVGPMEARIDGRLLQGCANNSSGKEKTGRKRSPRLLPASHAIPGPQNASPVRTAQAGPVLPGPDRALCIPHPCGQESCPGAGGLAPGRSSNPWGPTSLRGAGRWPWLPTGVGGGLCHSGVPIPLISSPFSVKSRPEPGEKFADNLPR